jgi:hypothetical protein
MSCFSAEPSSEERRIVELEIARVQRPVVGSKKEESEQLEHRNITNEKPSGEEKTKNIGRPARKSRRKRRIVRETSTDEPISGIEVPEETPGNLILAGPPVPGGLFIRGPADEQPSFDEPEAEMQPGVRLRWLERSISQGPLGPKRRSPEKSVSEDREEGRGETETPRQMRQQLGIPEPGSGTGSFDFYSPLDFNKEMAKARKKVTTDKMKHEYSKNNDRGYGVVCNVKGRWFLCKRKSLEACNKANDNLCRYAEKKEAEKLKGDMFF